MSYNIDHSETIKVKNCWMYKKDIINLYKTHTDDLAEINFISEFYGKFEEEKSLKKNLDEKVPIIDLDWSGGWSGNGFETLVKKIGPKIHGFIEVVFTWEGGDSTSALRIKDGKVTEPRVKFELEEDEGDE